jgi:hypothetical protein
MFELGKLHTSLDYLYQSLEAIHLSAAMMHTSMVRTSGSRGGGGPAMTAAAATAVAAVSTWRDSIFAQGQPRLGIQEQNSWASPGDLAVRQQGPGQCRGSAGGDRGKYLQQQHVRLGSQGQWQYLF